MKMIKLSSIFIAALLIFICYANYPKYFVITNNTTVEAAHQKHLALVAEKTKDTTVDNKQSFASSALVYLENGVLVYKPYANEGETNAVNVIPDFSNSGYRGGGVSLPNVTNNILEVNPIIGDATDLIQNAINTVSAYPLDAEGRRGVVLLKAGAYQINDTIRIGASGVILRGEGEGLFGTVIIDNLNISHPSIIVGDPTPRQATVGTVSEITDEIVPTGAKIINITANHGLKVGDLVAIDRRVNDNWLNTVNVAQYGWTTSAYTVRYERKIVAINGNTITIDIPIVDPIQAKYGGGRVVRVNRTNIVSECAVESIRMESSYESPTDLFHAWHAVQLKGAENCWVKNVLAKYYGGGSVNINHVYSRFNTVQDCGMIDHKSEITGANRYSFDLYKGTCNLYQRCYARSGRHDFVTGPTVAGPNVFLDGTADVTYNDIGPHQRWAAGILYDNIRGGSMNIENKGSNGSGHGWAGVQNMLWNCVSVNTRMTVESPIGGKNWGIGCIGTNKQGAGYWDSYGTPVEPRSLYLQQLQDRLGMDAVMAITTPEQRDGTLRDILLAKSTAIAAESKIVANQNGVNRAQYQVSIRAEDLSSLLDGASDTKYYIPSATSFWVQQSKLAPATETTYFLTSANDAPTRDPKSWKLEGSNDNATWVVLDSKTNQTFATRSTKYTFNIANPQSFKEYRLTVTANNGATGTQLADWGLGSNTFPGKPLVTMPPTQQVELFDNPFAITSINSYGWTNFETGAPANIAITSTSLNTVGTAVAKSVRLNGTAGMSVLPFGDAAGFYNLVTDKSAPLHVAFPIQVAAAPADGAYFMGLCTPSSINTSTQVSAATITQRNKIYIKSAATIGKFQIGIQTNIEAPTYGTQEYDLNHKYQLVMRWSEANRGIDLYIIDGDLTAEVPDEDSESKFDLQNVVSADDTSGFSFLALSQHTGIDMLVGGIILSNVWPTAPTPLIDITTGGTSSSQYIPLKTTERVGMLVDNNIATKFYYSATAATSQTFTLAKSSSSKLISYTITSANDVPNRDPKTWSIYGSNNNGTNWYVITSVTGAKFPARALTRTFAIPDNNTSYTSYQLRVTDYNGGTGLQMAEWRLYADAPQVLPVKLVNFTAKAQLSTVLLNWETASEINNSKFIIERRKTGETDFLPIGEVKGNGTKPGTSLYDFTDKNPVNGDNYYRLKQVDYDGRFEYSAVKVANFAPKQDNVIIYPNPFTSTLFIKGTTQLIKSITVIDLMGRTILTKVNPSTEIDLSHLSTGFYFLDINYADGKSSKHKIIKK